jgi:sulfite exporter TauE/SafE
MDGSGRFDPSVLLALCAEPGTWTALLGGLTSAGGIAVSLFIAGLISGVTHCAGMCGPFVLMRVVGRPDGDDASLSALRRLERAALWRYHLGRAITYTALGAIAASVAGVALEWVGLRWVLVAILGLAALMLALTAFRGSALPMPASDRLSAAMTNIVTRASRLGDLPLGLALGFLPCGVLYGALAAAASTGDALSGAVAMGAFVLGTVPGLVAVAIGGAFFARRFRIARAATMPLLALNIAILTAYALKAIA